MFKSNMNLNRLTTLLLTAAAVCVFQATPQNAIAQDAASESTLIDTLLNGAQKDKADACRQLAYLGTKNAVPHLAKLLTDDQMNHMARYALETIPDPSVDTALREALGKVKGRSLVGVIGSIGVRKDVAAIEALSKFLQDSDPDVAQAAARSLGKIGTAGAAKNIASALDGTTAANKLAFCEGLFRCAEALTKANDRETARGIYSQLAKIQDIHQVRAGALRGSIMVAEQPIPLLLQGIRSDDFVLVDAAARTALEMPGSEISKAIGDEMPKLNTDKGILFTQVLGKRADAAGLPALYAAAKSGDKKVRVAAIKAIPEIGKPQSAPELIALLGDTEREVAQAAQEALAGLQGAQVDQAILGMLKGNNPNLQAIAADLVARRRMNSAMPEMLQAASSGEAKVRQAALRRIGELGTIQNVPALLDLMVKSKGQEDTDAAEQALSSVCTKAGSPDACAEQITTVLPNAQPTQKSALLRVLSAVGGTKALQAVRAAVDEQNPQVHSAAIRALGSWESADAAPHLLSLAQSSQDPKDKMLCLRSYLALVSSHTDLAADRRLAMCKEAAALTQKSEEKKLLLSALGSIQTLDSLTAITPYLEDADIKNEASAAALSISDKLLKGRASEVAKNAGKLIPVLEKVGSAATQPALVQRAKTLLDQAKAKQAPGKK